MELISIASIVCAVFLSTNMDNLLCLIGFFSNKKIKTKHVLAGWFVGSIAIILISFSIAYIGTNMVPDKYLGILGIFPILIGIKGLFELKKTFKNQKTEKEINIQDSKSHVMFGAAVTLANGGDNISAYAPLFLITRGVQGICVAFVVFIFMIFSFSLIGYCIVRKNKILGQKICQYGNIALPFVLIFLGVSILIKSFGV